MSKMALKKLIEKYVVIEEQQNGRSQLVLHKNSFDMEYMLILDDSFEKIDIFDPNIVEEHINREKLKRSLHFFNKVKNMFTVDSI